VAQVQQVRTSAFKEQYLCVGMYYVWMANRMFFFLYYVCVLSCTIDQASTFMPTPKITLQLSRVGCWRHLHINNKTIRSVGNHWSKLQQKNLMYKNMAGLNLKSNFQCFTFRCQKRPKRWGCHSFERISPDLLSHNKRAFCLVSFTWWYH